MTHTVTLYLDDGGALEVDVPTLRDAERLSRNALRSIARAVTYTRERTETYQALESIDWNMRSGERWPEVIR